MRRAARTSDRGAPTGRDSPTIDAPRALVARELDAGGERFALLEWPASPPGPAPAALTSTEAEVAALAAAGLTNAQIALARRASSRTVANQLARVFRKLGARSRAELCARLTRGGPSPGGRR